MKPLASATLVLALAGCGGAERPAAKQLPPAAEPAVAPVPARTPSGRTVPLPGAPEGIALSASRGLAALAVRRPARLVIVAAATGRVVRRVALPSGSRHLRLAASGGPVLVPAEAANELLEVSLDGRVLRRRRTGRQPHDAVAAGGAVWVTDELAGTLSMLRGGRRTVVRGLVQPGGIAAAADRVAAVDVRRNDLTVLDVRSGARVARLPAGRGPTHAEGLGHGLVAVADTRGGAVLLFTLAGRPHRIARAALGGAPYGLAWDGRRRTLWVTLTARDEAVALRLGGGTLRRGTTLSTVRQPNSVAVDPGRGRLLVAGARPDGRLQIVAVGR